MYESGPRDRGRTPRLSPICASRWRNAIVPGVSVLWIDGPAGRLEASVRLARPTRAAAVVAHPHPLYGGTLHNPVVFHADRELHRTGFTTLRFNFRGAGASEGDHDEGRGEIDDLAAAVGRLRESAPDVPLLLVGYSFGAVCSLRRAPSDPGIAAVIAIGLPTSVYPLAETVAGLGRPLAVVQGSADELGPLDQVRGVLERAEPAARLYVVEGATHLFPGFAPRVAERVVDAADELLGSIPREV